MKQKHIIITGASTGIGLDLMLGSLKENWIVWACVRNTEVLNPFLVDWPEKLKVRKLDVTVYDEALKLVTEVTESLKSASETELVLINNAGIGTGGPLESVALAEWRKVFEVNVFGLVHTTQVFLPLLRKHHGTIVNIGSIAGRFATPYLSAYSSSKFAVKGLTEALRRELQGQNIRVILIEPGPIETPIWNKSLADSDAILNQMTDSQKLIYQKMTTQVLMALNMTAESAVPVSWVTQRLVRALKGSRKNRNILVGKGIHLQALALRVLPNSLLDRLVNLGLKVYGLLKKSS